MKAYLTIDDGPSEKFTALIDFLAARKVPAVFYNRGDNMEARPDAVLYGIRKGYIMANHSYSHPHFSTLTYEQGCEEIRRTDHILDDLYAQAGVKRPGKYFRYPYLDRGMGAALVEPGSMSVENQAVYDEILSAGLGHKPEIPGIGLIDKKRKWQQFLKTTGYKILPTPGITFPWYVETEMAEAIDSLCTFSTSDWALLERHKGKHGFNTIEDLKKKIDDDKWLKDKTSAHLIVAHDQAEIHEVTCALVDHLMGKGFVFQEF